MNTKRLNSGEVIPPDYFGRLWDDIRACEISGDGTTTRVDRSSGGATISAIAPGMAAAAPAGYEIIVPAQNLTSRALSKGDAVFLSYNKNRKFTVDDSAVAKSFFVGIVHSDCAAPTVGVIAPTAMVMIQGCTSGKFDFQGNFSNWHDFGAFLPGDGGRLVPAPVGVTAGYYYSASPGVIEIPVVLTFHPLRVSKRGFTWQHSADGSGVYVSGGSVINFGAVSGKVITWFELETSPGGVWLSFNKNSAGDAWVLAGFGSRVSGAQKEIKLVDANLNQLRDGDLYLPPATE